MTDAWDQQEELVGRWDPDARLFIATGWTYGPAGPARVDLGSGVQLSVDYANPATINEVTVEAPLTGDPTQLDERTADIARSLLGPLVLNELLDLARAGARPQPARLGDVERARRGGARPQAERFGRLAVGVSAVSDSIVTRRVRLRDRD